MTILCFSNRDTELGWLRYGCIMRYPLIEHLGTTIMIRNCQFYHGTGIAGPVRTFTGNGFRMEWYSKVTINKGRENGNLRKSIISLWHFSVSPATQICIYIYTYLSHIWWSIQETTASSIPQASSNQSWRPTVSELGNGENEVLQANPQRLMWRNRSFPVDFP